MLLVKKTRDIMACCTQKVTFRDKAGRLRRTVGRPDIGHAWYVMRAMLQES